MKICPDCGEQKDFSEFHRDMSKRDGCSTYCRMCAKVRSRRDYETHRETRLKAQKQYRLNNREAVRRTHRRYASKNQEKLKAYLHEYHKENKERRLTKLENDVEARLRYLLNSRRADAKKKNRDFTLTLDDLLTLLNEQNEMCAVTGIKFDMKLTRGLRAAPFGPSVDRIDSSQGYTKNNVQLVCFMVNMGKGQYPQELFDRMCIARVEQLNRG